MVPLRRMSSRNSSKASGAALAGRFQLLYGPYRQPAVPRNGYLRCKMRGFVPVGDWTEGPICWPCKLKTLSPILCGDLVRAVRLEAKATVGYYWGVSFATVNKWRKALKVKRWSKGSTALLVSSRAQTARLREAKKLRVVSRSVRRGHRVAPAVRELARFLNLR